MKEIGERVRALRRARNWSQMELAYRVGLSISGLRGIESGAASARVGTLAKIAKELDITLAALVSEQEDEVARRQPAMVGCAA